MYVDIGVTKDGVWYINCGRGYRGKERWVCGILIVEEDIGGNERGGVVY